MAATKQGVISHDNRLPWNYTEELEYFRSITQDNIVIMGRKTYDTIPSIFFNTREAIVFSRCSKLNGVTVVTSLDECMQCIQDLENQKTIFMIGGAEIAHLFLKNHLITSFILTKIHHVYVGDTYLNLDYFQDWTENILKSCTDYTISHLNHPKES
jgi:dihydrofolate reductase